jgi:hypothetical protein
MDQQLAQATARARELARQDPKAVAGVVAGWVNAATP